MKNGSAVIELGTKGIRLLVAEITDEKIQRVIQSTGDLSYLGKEADALGNLSENSIKRVTKLSKRYKEMAEECEVDNLYLVATDVVRRAPNRDQLIESLSDIAPLHILTEREEALCVFIASTAAFRTKLATGQPILVVDQGGGSTELVLGRLHDGVYIIEGIALASIGTSTLAREFLAHEYLSDGFSAVQKYVQSTLKEMPSLGNSAETLPKIAIAHGSAIMIFVRGIFRDQYGYEPKLQELHGKTVKSTLIERKVQETIPGLEGVRKKDLGDELKSDSEIVTLMSGILTYNEIGKQYNIQDFVISREGLRYGALLWKSGVKFEFQLPEDKINPS
jgi:exopolyphosphatase/guanosine-5'-triphosphate,3'-diphosphate pyrophosphatase